MDKISKLHARALNIHSACHCKGDCNCLEVKVVRHVNSPEGSRVFKLPIGSPIVAPEKITPIGTGGKPISYFMSPKKKRSKVGKRVVFNPDGTRSVVSYVKKPKARSNRKTPKTPEAWWKEEDGLVSKFEKEGMTTSDAQGAVITEMRKKYGASFEDLFTPKRKSLESDLEYKVSYSNDERLEMAKRGHAMKDGSYPIAHSTDLHNAVNSFGRAKDPTKVKEHIKKRAKELNMSYYLPSDWTVDDPNFGKTVDNEHNENVVAMKSIEFAEYKSLQEDIVALRVVAG